MKNRILLGILALVIAVPNFAAARKPQAPGAPRNPNTMARLSTFAKLWELSLVRHAPNPKPMVVSRTLNRVFLVSARETYEFHVAQVWPTLLILHRGENVAKYPYETEPQFFDRLEQIFRNEGLNAPKRSVLLEVLLPSAHADWSSFGLGVGAGWLATRLYGRANGGGGDQTVTNINNVYVDTSNLQRLMSQDIEIKKQLATLLQEQNEELRTANVSHALDRSHDATGASTLDRQVVQRELQRSFGADGLDFLRKMILHSPLVRDSSCSTGANHVVTSKVDLTLEGKNVSISKTEPTMGVEHLSFKVDGSPAVQVRSMVSFSHPGQDDDVQICSNGSCKPAASDVDAAGLMGAPRASGSSPLAEARQTAVSNHHQISSRVSELRYRHLSFQRFHPEELLADVKAFQKTYAPREQSDMSEFILSSLKSCKEAEKPLLPCLTAMKSGSFFSSTPKDRVLKGMIESIDRTEMLQREIHVNDVMIEAKERAAKEYEDGIRQARQDSRVNWRPVLEAVKGLDSCNADKARVQDSFREYSARICARESENPSDVDFLLYCGPEGRLLEGDRSPALVDRAVELLAQDCAHQKKRKDAADLQNALAFATYQYRCCQYQHCADFMEQLKSSRLPSGESSAPESGTVAPAR